MGRVVARSDTPSQLWDESSLTATRRPNFGTSRRSQRHAVPTLGRVVARSDTSSQLWDESSLTSTRRPNILTKH
ncbi:MAG: hypothetical protein LBD91_07600 [Prevotellaceae bacterium]|nr:hypothetical protein [Prevotellaceae bacterium]